VGLLPRQEGYRRMARLSRALRAAEPRLEMGAVRAGRHDASVPATSVGVRARLTIDTAQSSGSITAFPAVGGKNIVIWLTKCSLSANTLRTGKARVPQRYECGYGASVQRIRCRLYEIKICRRNGGQTGTFQSGACADVIR
jgi:hypothetical protein